MTRKTRTGTFTSSLLSTSPIGSKKGGFSGSIGDETSSKPSGAGLTSGTKSCFCFDGLRSSGPAQAGTDGIGQEGYCPQCILRQRVEIALNEFRQASPAQRAPAREQLKRELDQLSAELNLWSANP